MSTVTFNVSVEESHSVLKKVLPLMSQHQVPTIPQNYALWYDFVCEANGELVGELKDHMTRGLKFSPDACQKLYEKYFLHELRAQVNEIQGAMRAALESAAGELSGLDEELGGFVVLLEDAGRTLAGEPSPAEVAALVTRLAEETRVTRDRSAGAEASVRAMKLELDELRTQVDALSRDARQDALTGVANRRAFDDGLRRMMREVRDSDAELCLLLADVDRFGDFNERQGRTVADQVLRFVAQEMDQCVKGRDLLARFGGAEFAVLLPATSYNGALMLAESIRAIIEAQVVQTDNGLSIEDLTISLGVTQCRSGEEADELVARTEACLQQSKADGRNRVTGERDLRG
jgi:diguanylate cyclase